MGIEGPFPSLAAVGFAALGFLPAVVVHSVLRDEHQTVRGAAKRALAAIAYAVSGLAAAAAHLRRMDGRPRFRRRSACGC